MMIKINTHSPASERAQSYTTWGGCFKTTKYQIQNFGRMWKRPQASKRYNASISSATWEIHLCTQSSLFIRWIRTCSSPQQVLDESCRLTPLRRVVRIWGSDGSLCGFRECWSENQLVVMLQLPRPQANWLLGPHCNYRARLARGGGGGCI